MPTTDTLTKRPHSTHAETGTATTTIDETPADLPHERTTSDVLAGRVGLAFALAAAIGVAVLIWAVIAGPSDTTQPTNPYDRVEQNRTNTLRDLTTQPTNPYDRVEQNRTNTLRDLTTQPTNPYDRVEQNRTNTLRDLTTQPTNPYDRVELNRTNTLRDLTTQPTNPYDRVEQNRTNTLRDLTTLQP